MINKVKGYFTVEAAFLFPFVLGCLLFVIYSWFYQYDRCLMEQDIGALTLWGSILKTQEKEDLIKQLTEREREADTDKYVAWEQGKTEIKLEKDVIRVKRRGQVKFPFAGLNFWKKDSIWAKETVFENRRIPPALFIRSWRKMIGGK